MLEAFRTEVYEFLQRGFGAARETVWIYCHYPSSARYSTLHFHIIFGSRFEKHARKLERPHQLSRQFSLDRILENLKTNPRFYAEAELSYFLGDKADLMDPLSMFWSCSPHRHIDGFTFKWDEHAILADKRLNSKVSTAGDGIDVETPSMRVGRSCSTPDRSGDRIQDMRCAELRRSIDELRRKMVEMAGQMVQLESKVDQLVVEGRCTETGACRLALELLVAERVAERSLAWRCTIWGTLLGIALCVVASSSLRWRKFGW